VRTIVLALARRTGQSALVDDSEGERALAVRWRVLVDISLAELPEIAEELDEDDAIRTLGAVWTTVVRRGAGDDRAPIWLGTSDFWVRALRVVELVEEALVLIADDPAREEDASELGAFSIAGVLCEVTGNLRGLERLLPLMGPLSVGACRDEVEVHEVSRGFNGSAVDWALAGTSFQRLAVEPSTVLPEVG
jgi:hypothetical protein